MLQQLLRQPFTEVRLILRQPSQVDIHAHAAHSVARLPHCIISNAPSRCERLYITASSRWRQFIMSAGDRPFPKQFRLLEPHARGFAGNAWSVRNKPVREVLSAPSQKCKFKENVPFPFAEGRLKFVF